MKSWKKDSLVVGMCLIKLQPISEIQYMQQLCSKVYSAETCYDLVAVATCLRFSGQIYMTAVLDLDMGHIFHCLNDFDKI